MKRTFLAAVLIGSCASAQADSWTNYLKIDCEPSIVYFKVQPVGTWIQDVDPPKSFVPINNGWNYDGTDGELQMTPGSDDFGECNLPYNSEDIAFSVVRTHSFQPSGCQSCGVWRAIFEIRLNEHVLVRGRHGRGDMRALKSVEYDGHEIRICETLAPHHYREIEDGHSTISCQILGWREIQELVAAEGSDAP